MENTEKKKRFSLSFRNRTLVVLILLGFMLPFMLLVVRQQQTIKQEAATTHQVFIKNFTMNPPSITIQVGDTVTWTNQDNDAHDATSSDGSWGTPLLSNGESASVTFDEPGVYDYWCSPHQGTMNGYKVTVLPAPTATRVNSAVPTTAPVMTATPPVAQPTTVPPTQVPTQVPTVPPQPTAVPQQTGGGTTNLSLTLLLHGIGNAGDNANPTNSEQSNKNPQQSERLVRVILINSSGQTIGEPSGTVTFSQQTGDFRGTVSLGSNFPAGTYTVKVRIQNYLQKIIARDFTITNNAINTIPAAQLIAGDVDGNNTLDAEDYNAVVKCLSKDTTGSTCFGDEVKKVDLNDDGIITIADTNLLLREFSLRTGD